MHGGYGELYFDEDKVFVMIHGGRVVAIYKPKKHKNMKIEVYSLDGLLEWHCHYPCDNLMAMFLISTIKQCLLLAP